MKKSTSHLFSWLSSRILYLIPVVYVGQWCSMKQPKAFVWPSCTWEPMLMLLMLSVPVIYAEQCCCVAFMYFGATVNVAWESINFFKPIPRNHFSLLSKWTFLFTLNRSVLKLLMSNEAGHAATSLKREKRIPHLQKISICGIWRSPFLQGSSS